MKNIFLLLFGVAFLILISCEEKVDIDTEKANVKTVVDQLEQMLETEDMELLSRIFAHDTDMVNFGTDAAERIVGWESLNELMQKQNAAAENSKLTVNDQVIKVNKYGNTAWFSEVVDWDVVAQGQPASLQGLRFTGVLEKRNGNWVIVQMHISVPVSGQAFEY